VIGSYERRNPAHIVERRQPLQERGATKARHDLLTTRQQHWPPPDQGLHPDHDEHEDGTRRPTVARYASAASMIDVTHDRVSRFARADHDP
jgi:hypothetical protein